MPLDSLWFAPTSLFANEIAVRGSSKWTVVELRDSDGVTGLAEVTHPESEAVVRAVAWLGRKVRGERVRSDSDLFDRLGIVTSTLSEDFVLATAVSGLRSAFADALARRAELPLNRYLMLAVGSERRATAPSVALYANINRSMLPHRNVGPGTPNTSSAADRSSDAFAEVTKRAVAAGFKSVKCAPFDECRAPFNSVGLPEKANTGLDRVRAVIDAAGPDVRVLVDCHSRFDENSAIAVAQELRSAGVSWVEEPVDPIAHSSVMRRVRDALATSGGSLPVQVAGGEGGYGFGAFDSLIGDGSVDVVMPDVKHCGGASEAFAIGRNLEARQARSVSMHSPSGPVSLLTSAHVTAAFAAGLGHDVLPLEHAVYEIDWRSTVLEPAERIESGAIWLPGDHGIGASLDPSTVRSRGRRWEP